jgi:hypothetical protein
MGRPKVTFLAKPPAFWSIIHADAELAWIYCVVDLELRNDGNEETHITQTNLILTPTVSASFDFEAVCELPNDGLIGCNGGRLQHRMIYRLKKPLPYKQTSAGDESDYFNEPFAQFGRLAVNPSQNKRLLWGSSRVSSEIKAEHVDEVGSAAGMAARPRPSGGFLDRLTMGGGRTFRDCRPE